MKIITTDEKLFPKRMTEKAIGYDIYYNGEQVKISSKGIYVASTGLYMLADNEWLFITPRSGLAVKYGLTILNTPGLIDSDYTGEIKVILINHGENPLILEPYTRIAQMIVMPNPYVDIECITNKNPDKYVLKYRKKRDGLGHTGIN